MVTEQAKSSETFQRLEGFISGHKDLIGKLLDEIPDRLDVPEDKAARLGRSIDQAIERIRVEGPLHFPESKN